MKNFRILALAIALILLTTMAACSKNPAEPSQKEVPMPQSQSSGQIYLYGEQHGVEKILDKELELWREYYHNEGMRHLFIESPYYTAEFLNIWMKADSDDILNAIYKDCIGTASNTYMLAFYQNIKSDFPETIFHGTDVGHQYNTTGKRFLKYLEENNMKGSEQYLLAQEAIEQGKFFYVYSDDAYRENRMTENFIREFDALEGKNVMGIYGGAHTGIDAIDDKTKSVTRMANQLKERYGKAVYSEDLGWLAIEIEPDRAGTINVNGEDYEASYFGKQDLSGFKDYSYREFWRLENAYDDFKNKKKTGDVLPYVNYPMLIETGQVFVIDYAKVDGSVARMYYRSDGSKWNGRPTTVEFATE